MKKKILSVLLAASMVFSALPANILNAADLETDDEYILEDAHAEEDFLEDAADVSAEDLEDFSVEEDISVQEESVPEDELFAVDDLSGDEEPEDAGIMEEEPVLTAQDKYYNLDFSFSYGLYLQNTLYTDQPLTITLIDLDTGEELIVPEGCYIKWETLYSHDSASSDPEDFVTVENNEEKTQLILSVDPTINIVDYCSVEIHAILYDSEGNQIGHSNGDQSWQIIEIKKDTWELRNTPYGEEYILEPDEYSWFFGSDFYFLHCYSEGQDWAEGTVINAEADDEDILEVEFIGEGNGWRIHAVNPGETTLTITVKPDGAEETITVTSTIIVSGYVLSMEGNISHGDTLLRGTKVKIKPIPYNEEASNYNDITYQWSVNTDYETIPFTETEDGIEIDTSDVSGQYCVKCKAIKDGKTVAIDYFYFRVSDEYKDLFIEARIFDEETGEGEIINLENLPVGSSAVIHSSVKLVSTENPEGTPVENITYYLESGYDDIDEYASFYEYDEVSGIGSPISISGENTELAGGSFVITRHSSDSFSWYVNVSEPYDPETESQMIWGKNLWLDAIYEEDPDDETVEITYDPTEGYWSIDEDGEKDSDPRYSYVEIGDVIDVDWIMYPEHDTKLFAGWSLTENPTLDDIDLPAGDGMDTHYGPVDNAYITVTENITLYAVWADAVVITYYPNGGYFWEYEDDEEIKVYTPRAQKVLPGSDIYSMMYDVPEHDSKAFIGWATKENPTKDDIVLPADDDDCNIPAQDGLCLYAVWDDGYKVTYNLNGGYWYEGNSDAVTQVYPKDTSIRADEYNIPISDEKVFIGWATDMEGRNIILPLYEYDNEGGRILYKLTEDMNLFAVWADPVRITWNLQGGHWSDSEPEDEDYYGPTDTIYAPGEWISSNDIDNVTAPDENEVFAGWSLTENGDIWLPYNSSKQVTKDLDGQTLYAIYDAPIVITLNGGEGSFSQSDWDEYGNTIYEGPSVISEKIAAGSVFRLYPEIFHKEGYVLSGWTEDGNADPYFNYRNYYFDSSITLNAVWKEAATITWNPNGGILTNVRPETQHLPYQESVALNEQTGAPEVTKENSALIGWADESGEIVIQRNGPYVPTRKTVTLTAQWVPGYKVTYNANGGHTDNPYYPETERTIMVPEGQTVDTVYEFVREGKAFAGWAVDDPNGEPLEYIWDYKVTKDTVFYAVWVDGYQVTYELCGGTRYDGAQSYTKMLPKNAILYRDEGSYNLIPPAGKAFVGWSTVNNDKTHLLPDYSSEMMRLTGPITLYAIWEDGCLVTYDANGGYYNNNPADTSYSETVPKGSSIQGIRVLNHSDSSLMFIGYSTSKDRKDLVFDYMRWTTDYLFTDNVTLYAIWVPSHKVIFDGNGEDISEREPYDRYEFTLPEGGGYYGYQILVIPEDLKPFFKGWSTTPDGKNIFDFTDKTVTSDITFYAVWNVTYSVNYQFVSASEEELPRAVLALCPADYNEYEDGQTVTLAGPEKNRKVETDEGYWTFEGYDKNSSFVIEGEDVTVTGTWTYTEETPSIEYEFISAGEDALPQTVKDLLPENSSAVKGSTVTPVRPAAERVEDGDYVWTFMGYSPASAKLGSSGIIFKGTWQRSEKDEQVFYIDYEFTASPEDIAEAGELPDEVMVLLPQRTPVYEGDTPVCASLTRNTVAVKTDTVDGNWVFEGFDTTDIEDLPNGMTADVTLTGTWKFESRTAAADFAADVISGIADGVTGGGNADDLIDILDKADSADILEQLTQNIVDEIGNENPDELNAKLAEATAKLDEQLTDESNDESRKITVSDGTNNVGAFIGATEPAEGSGITVEVSGAAPTVASVIRGEDTATLMANDSQNYHYQAEVSVTKVKEQGTELTLDISLDIKIAETGRVVKENVEPTTPVTVTMSLPENFIGQDLKLIHTLDEKTGETEEIQYSVIGDGSKIQFTLSSLSPFELQILNCRHKFPLTHVDGKGATCTNAGYEEYYECSICGLLFSDVEGTTKIDGPVRISPTGHHASLVNKKNATCKDAGHIEYYQCSGCGKKFKDPSCTFILSDKEIVIPKTNVHKWNSGKVTKAATEDTTGIRTHTCTVCKKTKTSVIPKIAVKITINKTPTKFKAKAAKKGKVTLTWKKLEKKGKTKALYKQVSKIEIQYSTNSNFTSGVVKLPLLSKTKAKKVIKLKPKTTYYFRIRYTDGKGGCSKWVKKTVKTKK